MIRIRTLVFLALACALAAPLSAQSLFATRGLGAPLLGADARGQALGGMTTGMLGLNAAVENVADASGIIRRGMAAAIQPTIRSIQINGQTDHISATRFPLVHVYYPVSSRFVVTAGYGGFLDQNWGLTTTIVQHVGTDSATARDLVQSVGGIAQLKVGVAFAITPSLSIGVGSGLYTGGVLREVARTFPDSATNLLRGFTTRTEWSYHAPLATAGARLNLGSFARIGAAVTWSGKLNATGLDSTALDRTFNLPLQEAFGVSALLAPRLMLAANAQHANWSTTAGQFQGGVLGNLGTEQTTARDTWNYGAGIEYELVGGAGSAIRLGARKTQYPFSLKSDTPVNESTYSFGYGRRLSGDEANPLALVDVAIEHGSRSGGPSGTAGSNLKESFWRLTVSLQLFGR
jgi:hypothetical protein